MKKQQIICSLLLILTAAIWGCAFVAQSVGMDYVGAFTFNGVRSLLGCALLLCLLPFLDRVRGTSAASSPSSPAVLWKGGLCCGLALFVASNFQQFGLKYTTVSKAGFLTTFYIIIVPILGIFFGKKPSRRIWLSVLIALAGLYLLCMKERLSLSFGDTLVITCAFLFSIQIMAVDHFAPMVDPIRLSCIQLGVSGVLATICALLFEHPQLSQLRAALIPILYAGLFSSGVAYTLQIVAQKGLSPTVASLLMSLESVMAALAGWILLGQVLSFREISGCVLIFGAIILAQLPDRKGVRQ